LNVDCPFHNSELPKLAQHERVQVRVDRFLYIFHPIPMPLDRTTLKTEGIFTCLHGHPRRRLRKTETVIGKDGFSRAFILRCRSAYSASWGVYVDLAGRRSRLLGISNSASRVEAESGEIFCGDQADQSMVVPVNFAVQVIHEATRTVVRLWDRAERRRARSRVKQEAPVEGKFGNGRGMLQVCHDGQSTPCSPISSALSNVVDGDHSSTRSFILPVAR